MSDITYSECKHAQFSLIFSSSTFLSFFSFSILLSLKLYHTFIFSYTRSFLSLIHIRLLSLLTLSFSFCVRQFFSFSRKNIEEYSLVKFPSRQSVDSKLFQLSSSFLLSPSKNIVFLLLIFFARIYTKLPACQTLCKRVFEFGLD